MHRFHHSLHPHIPLPEQHVSRGTVLERGQQESLVATQHRQHSFDLTASAASDTCPPSRAFAITTVSLNFNFDAYILVGLAGSPFSAARHLIMDSGNTSLILPRWEDIAAIPDYQQTYQLLGQVTEPWGCPANVVKGPIQLSETSGEVFTIEDCIFLACTGDSPAHQRRTANFGAGCIDPWSANAANKIESLGITLQPVLSHTAYRYLEFDYASTLPREVNRGDGATAASTAASTSSAKSTSTAASTARDSCIRIHSEIPAGFQLFDIVRDCPWMSLVPTGLRIAGSATGWPDGLQSPIAMIDTGGGPVYLGDPRGALGSREWPQPVPNPAWAAGSPSTRSIQAPVEITLGDGSNSYTYVVQNAHLAAEAGPGQTLVMFQDSPFMRDHCGMNVGGISALANAILVDFSGKKVGLKQR